MKYSNPSKTILVICIGFIYIFYFTKLNWALFVAIIIGSASILSSKFEILTEKIWYKFSKVLSLIIPNIILTALFYLILFPISIISKLFGNKSLIRIKKSSESNFAISNKKFDSSSFENPW